MIPQDLKFLESHEWVRIDEATGEATVGLSEFAVEQLGDIVYLELPNVGDMVAKGGALGAIESVKAASDLYAPVSGEVLEVNDAAADNLDLFKEDAYGQAWIARIKMSDAAEAESLLSAAGYEESLKPEEKSETNLNL